MSENAAVNEKAESGLQINKKTLLGITILLVVIIAFVGVLTQVMTRGEYYVYPENTYKLGDGRIVCLADGEKQYTVDGKTKIGLDEYLTRLNGFDCGVT